MFPGKAEFKHISSSTSKYTTAKNPIKLKSEKFNLKTEQIRNSKERNIVQVQPPSRDLRTKNYGCLHIVTRKKR
jgi:hypothetical protein